MAYLVTKILIALLIVGNAAALNAHEQTLPNDGLGTYKEQNCCPTGYYAAGQFCVKCNQPKHWDPINLKCVLCPDGYTWNKDIHVCDCCTAPRQVIGDQCLCPGGRTWTGVDCLCPAGTYGPNCIPCPAPRFWDNVQNQCVCPQNRTWSGNECVCTPGLYGPQCVPCPAPRFWQNGACVCAEKRMWNGQNCVCAPGLYGPNCVACPSEQHWDEKTQTCLCQAPLIWNGQHCACTPPTTVFDGVKCVCPADTYGPQCVPCPAPRFWQNGACVCAEKRVWNGQNCICASGFYGPNCVACPSEQHWDEKTQTCLCQAPFVWSGQHCVCPAGWQLRNVQCTRCPAGYTWKNNQCTNCDCKYLPPVWLEDVLSGSTGGNTISTTTNPGVTHVCPTGSVWDDASNQCLHCPLPNFTLQKNLSTGKWQCFCNPPFKLVTNADGTKACQ